MEEQAFWGIYEIGTIVSIIFYSIIFGIWGYKNRSNRILNTIPAFCTGIGIFFTFWVLFWTLSKFGLDKEGKPIDEIEIKVIIKLVSNLVRAFSTSIIGVLCSLITSPIIKFFIDKLEKEEQKETPYQLLTMISNSNVELVKAVKALRGNDTEKVSSLYDISQSINGISSKMIKELGHLKEQLEGTIKKIGEDSIKDVKEFSTNFKDQTVSSLNEYKEVLAEILQKFGQNITNVNKNIDEEMADIKESVSTQMEQMKSKFEEEATDLKKIFEEVKSSLTNLSSNIEKDTTEILLKNQSLLEDSFKRLKNWQILTESNLEVTTKEFSTAVEQYQAFTHNQEDVIKSVENQVKEVKALRTDAKSLLTASKDFANEVQKLQGRINDIGNTITTLGNIEEVLRLESNGHNSTEKNVQ